MHRPRIIPCLLLKNGLLVRSERFVLHQIIGNPISTISRFSTWNVDELIILDISDVDTHDLRRDDLHITNIGNTFLDIIRSVANVCVMPLAVGGRIRTLADIRERLEAGADKCVINTAAVNSAEFITAAARRFGSQCIVVNIDAKRRDDGVYEVYTHGGSRATGLEAAVFAQTAANAGAGEIFLNSIDRDGTGEGLDGALIRSVAGSVQIPVIACGGVGHYEHLAAGIAMGASDVAAANIFHFCELSYPLAKQACIDAGVPARSAPLGSTWFPREPQYDRLREDERLSRRLSSAHGGRRPSFQASRQPMRWCTRCVYPMLSATPMSFDKDGVCMGCRTSDVKRTITPAEWSRRRKLLQAIIEEYARRTQSDYDCIIPVSGGKDSYFQTHVITKELGLKPLLVTYNGNNYTDVGWRNVHRMREVFGVDHVFFSPSVPLLTKLNRLAFMIMGDMNWHAHVGIMTYPVRAAVETKTPLLIYGEHGYLDLCGQFSMDDFPEINYRSRLEHFARGFEWNYFVGREGIAPTDMTPYKYPCDSDLLALKIRGIHLGNYVPWEANEHGPLMVKLYGFETSDEPFDRTYRRMSNLDDMHENGVHDYLKYIKFGYGRCTDHASKDIRAGIMTRAQGVELVRQYDHVKPRDLRRWLEYVGMSESEFDRIADTFRDPRVWELDDGEWIKDNLWDCSAAYRRDGLPAMDGVREATVGA